MMQQVSEQGRGKSKEGVRGFLLETRNCQRDEEVQRQINRINKSHGLLIKTEPAKQQKGDSHSHSHSPCQVL